MAFATPVRDVRMGNLAARLQKRADGSMLVVPQAELGSSYSRSIGDDIAHWAERTPDAIMVADRNGGGDGWRTLTYRQVIDRLPGIAQALLDHDLGPERPLAILSGNDIEHLLLGLAAIWVGIPFSPVSPAYSLVSRDFTKLGAVIGQLTPGLIYVADGKAFTPALAAAVPPEVPVIAGRNLPPDRDGRLFDMLCDTEVSPAVSEAHAAMTPDTIAKVLFTSGSTGTPKGVITTNRMMSCNQEMIRSALAFLRDAPPVVLDWMPWHHVAGGSHNTGIAFSNGGTFYIDDGAPTPERFSRTLRNLSEVQPTIYFNVPKGFEFLVASFADNPIAQRNFFARLNVIQYAGASLSQHVFDGLERAAIAELGERVMIITGYGSTETAPFAFTTGWPVEKAGHIGLPAAGMTAKLVPNEGKLELRLAGPNVSPGYWRDPAQSAAMRDEEGYYKIGDALAFVDENDLSRGFKFDGRVSDDFKLSTGTWVNFSSVRSNIIAACAPLVRDVVLTGADRNFIGALIFVDPDACAREAGLPADSPLAASLQNPAVASAIASRLKSLAKQSTGSSNHVARAMIMREPPDIEAGEITDKGSINQRRVLAQRSKLVGQLHAENVGADDDLILCPRNGDTQ